MRKRMTVWGGIALGVTALLAAEIPDVLKTVAGKQVNSVAAWEQERRPEVLELFQTQVFGRNPVARPATLRFEAVDSGTASGTTVTVPMVNHGVNGGGYGTKTSSQTWNTTATLTFT